MRKDLASDREGSLALQAKLLLTPVESGFDPLTKVCFAGEH